MTHDRLRWTKSSRSSQNDNCVEVAPLPRGGRALRDSKLGGASPILAVPGEHFAAFVADLPQR